MITREIAPEKLVRRCCDFKKLERGLREYCKAHNLKLNNRYQKIIIEYIEDDQGRTVAKQKHGKMIACRWLILP